MKLAGIKSTDYNCSMAQVTIVTGSAGSGKTEWLLDGYRAALDRARSEQRPGMTLWLTPTRRIQKAIAQQIVTRSGLACFTPNVLTFDLFAEKILEASGQPASPISPVIKRLILRRIAAKLLEKGELRHFSSIAGTTGFLDVVSNFISELKREEIWPDEFINVCQQRKSAFARRDLELGLIYEQYQQHLENQKWYDNEGRFWLARSALEQGEKNRGPFAEVRFLAVDGFADFTKTQYEILGFLADWIDDVSISLPVEYPLTRSDLFSKPQAAINRIKERLPSGATLRMKHLHPGTTTETSGRTSSEFRGWPNAICVVADRLFSNPRTSHASTDASGLEIIATTGQFGEFEAVARRIKQMLAGDQASSVLSSASEKSVRPQDIVIGLRSISEDGPRLRDYLAAAGLPVWCEAELPFTSSSIVKAVLSLLQLELDNWPFDRLIGVLDSTFFQPNWAEWQGGKATRAVAASLRQLRVNSGQDLILKALARFANDATSTAATRPDSLKTLAQLALPLLSRLSRSLEKLRRSHTLSDWADVLAAVVDDLGWTRRTATSPTDMLLATELRDLDLLQRILRTAAEADQKLAGNSHPRLASLAEFTAELRDLLSHERLNSAPEIGGCIRILSVEQIRNLDVPYLFLMGMTENSFPKNRADDCLFSESERQDFISRGIELSHRSGHHAEEMLLFYSIVTRARRSLTLTFPEVNLKGQPVFQSPYVKALMLLFSPDSVVIRTDGKLDPVPDPDRVLTFTDLRLSAMDQAQKGRPGLFHSLLEIVSLRSACWNSLAACEVADHRFHQRGFTGYEGRLELVQNLNGLRHRFGSHHQFSATELEAYARCPFQFWLANVLRIGAVESPEEGTDYARRGTLLHDVVAQLLIEGVLDDPAALQSRFVEQVNSLLDRDFPETELRRSLIEVERMILSRWAEAFAEQQSGYDLTIGELLKNATSLAPEIPFGKLPEAPTAAEESHPPIQFGRDEHAVKVRGRIDRVDVGQFEGHPAYVVIDYKTGQRPSLGDSDLISGRSIQLALYLLAIKRLGLVGPEAIPLQMGYWVLHDTGFKHGHGGSKFKPIPPGEIQRMETVLDHLLPELAEDIRSGRFVVENEDENCTGRCPYRTVCRVNQLRPLAVPLGKRSPQRIDPTTNDDPDK